LRGDIYHANEPRQILDLVDAFFTSDTVALAS
jgi:hypothetical protein